jgi:hypothetical protein
VIKLSKSERDSLKLPKNDPFPPGLAPNPGRVVNPVDCT